MLLELVNLRLREQYHNVDEMCSSMNMNKKIVMERLAEVGYHYDPDMNQFINDNEG